MKKIERGQQFITKNIKLFRCNVCHEPYTDVQGTSLICPNQHQLDLNKKGSLVFLNHAVNTEYDDKMLTARRQVLTAGLFDGIIDAVAGNLPNTKQVLLDVGTGEGTPLARLLERRSSLDTAIGFDISKAGVNLATQLDTSAFFTVADLAQLPFNDASFDSVVEFFSPSAYQEFNRVLKPGGKIIKVVPNKNYLHELREMLYPVDSPNHTYDNQKVVDRFMDQYPGAEIQNITYQWEIPSNLWIDLLHMTPLHWGARQEAQSAAEQTSLPFVTVDIQILTTINEPK